ncbi:MAG: BamA/TamA family outer membrane protein, partial [Candidatus Eisenbacteria bacterium]
EELGGWFLEPVQLRLDNLTGRGEEFALAFRLGWRNAGVHLDWRNRSFAEPRRYWGFGLHSETLSRLYFADGAEIAHPVTRGSAELALGVPLYSKLGLELSARTETVRPDSTAKLNVEASDGRSAGTTVPTDELPDEIRRTLEERRRTWLGASVVLDRRIGSGLGRSGAWGDVGYALALSRDDRAVHRGHLDARAYFPAGTWQVASRVSVEAVSAAAPFYDRLYLGGLYTVRGYPSHALTPAAGDLFRATSSVELRAPLLGDGPHPRVVGIAFLDLGVGSDLRGRSTTAIGLGYGWRVRIPWLGHLGLDVGVPLSDSPVDDAFHGNLSLGWTY